MKRGNQLTLGWEKKSIDYGEHCKSFAITIEITDFLSHIMNMNGYEYRYNLKCNCEFFPVSRFDDEMIYQNIPLDFISDFQNDESK